MDAIASPPVVKRKKRRPFIVPDDIALLRDMLTQQFGQPGWGDIARKLRARLLVYKRFGCQRIINRKEEVVMREYAKRSHCKRGHPLVPENVYQRVTPKGYVQRKCKKCRLQYWRDRYRKRQSQSHAG